MGVLESALREHGEDARFRHWLARSHYELREYDKSIAEAETAVELRSGSSEYHRWLGKAYGGKAKESRSLWLARKVKREFAAAVELDPTNVRVRRDLLQFLVKAPKLVGGGKKKARAQVAAIADLDPLEGHLARAYYLRKTDDLAGVRAEYERVFDLQPEPAGPYFEIADASVKLGRSVDVDRAVEAAAARDASDTRVSYYRGVARVMAGEDLDEALELLEAYLRDSLPRSDRPSYAGAHEWLGELYEQAGDPEMARSHYRMAIELDPAANEAREKLDDLSVLPQY